MIKTVKKRDAVSKALLCIRDNRGTADRHPDLFVHMWDESITLVNHLHFFGFITRTPRMLLWDIVKRYFWN